MIANVGSTDRMLRIALGVILILLAVFQPFPFLGDSVVATVVAIVGAVLVLTAVISFCPLYRIIGVATNRKPPEANAE